MKIFLKYLSPYYLRVLFTVSVKLSAAVTELFIPWILEYIIDVVIPNVKISQDLSQIFIWGGLMLLCALAAYFFNVIANRSASNISNKVTYKLRQDLYEHIFQLSCSEVDRFTIPSLISRLSSDTYHVRNMIGMTLRIGIRAPILLAGGILMTLIQDSVLALVMIGIIPFIAFVAFFISRKGLPLYTKVQEMVDVLVMKVREFYTGIRVIKALSQVEREKNNFDKINKELVKREKKSGIVMEITNPTITILLNIALSLVIFVGAVRINVGLSEAGKVIAFMSYFTIISNAVTMVNRIFVNLTKGNASANRIGAVLESVSSITVMPEDRKETDNYIEFNNVTFSYEGTSEDSKTLENINFSIKHGETLGIIGETGSGKSTIIQLLMRFYDVDEGDIRIDGYNIKSLPLSELRGKFGVTFQNDFLMADTIAENISLGRNISRDEITKATQYAHAAEFIADKNGALDYKLDSRAANLSGGQKQRLLISRALAADPEILILDDASSALDYKTDAQLRKEINDNFKNTTKIIIAQRISSIRHADKILVLHRGNVCGYGTDNELIKNCPHYREIARSQNEEVEL